MRDGDAGGAERVLEERHREEAVDVADGEQRGRGDVEVAQHVRDRADLRAVGRGEAVERRVQRAVRERDARRRERHERRLCACQSGEGEGEGEGGGDSGNLVTAVVRCCGGNANDAGEGAADDLDLGAAVGADDEAAAGGEERGGARGDVRGRVVREDELDVLRAGPLAVHVRGRCAERPVELWQCVCECVCVWQAG